MYKIPESPHSISIHYPANDHADLKDEIQTMSRLDQAVRKKVIETLKGKPNAKIPQVYGTQVSHKDGKLSLYEVEDLDRLDERRLAVGLPTIDAYKKFVCKNYGVTEDTFE